MKPYELMSSSTEAPRDKMAIRTGTIDALTEWAGERGGVLSLIDFVPHTTRILLAVLNGSEEEKNNFVIAAYRLKGKVAPYSFVKDIDERDPKWVAANDARRE